MKLAKFQKCSIFIGSSDFSDYFILSIMAKYHLMPFRNKFLLFCTLKWEFKAIQIGNHHLSSAELS